MMDEVEVLVESIEYRAHMKSAPMVGVKPKPKSNFPAGGTTDAPPPLSSSFSLPVEKLDAIFRSDFKNNKTEQPLNLLGEDDSFVYPLPISNQYKEIDLENVLNNLSNRTNDHNPNSGNSVGSNEYDLLGLQSKQTDSGNDQVIEKQENKESVLEDLIPGFAVAPPSDNGVESKMDLAPESNGPSIKSKSNLENDPFVVFEPSVPQSDASWPFAGPTEQATEKDSIQSSFDELDDFVNDSRTGGNWTATNTPSAGLASNGFENIDDLDTFFRGGVEEKNDARPTSMMQDSQFDFISGEDKGAERKQNSSPATNIGDLLGDVTTSSEEFREIEGEPEERRRARLNRHMRINARVAEALAEKNQRDLQNQHEQDEKHRLSETLDNDIKSWSQGREGNLRALLSSLQQVLWPECNWRPVSLADLMASDSVKKAYKKATLYVHPDKVQQKGANLQQKYIAEKVFDLLQEAWIRFSSEELR